MEPLFTHYLYTVKRYLPRLLLLSILAALLALVISRRIGTSYQVHFSYLISLRSLQQTSDYQFDGYYALQATELFTKTMAELMSTPETVFAAYKAAHLPLPTDQARALERSVTAFASAPQLLEVTITGDNRETTERLAEGLRAVAEEYLTRYHQQGTMAYSFRAMPTEAWTSVTSPNQQLISAATFLVVLIGGINLILLRASLRSHEDRD